MAYRIVTAGFLCALMVGCGGGGGGDDCAGGVKPADGCTCSYPVKNPTAQVCTREITTLPVEVQRAQCGDLKEYCAADAVTAPKLGCLTAGAPNEPATPATVTLTGWVNVFSSGPDSNNVKVQVFDAAQLDAAASPDQATPLGEANIVLNQPAFDNHARFCPNPTSDLGRTDATCRPQTGDCGTSCPEGTSPSGTRFCLNTVCEERLRVEVRYEIPNIPTKRFLAIRTLGSGGVQDPLWAPVVQYNVYLSTAARACTKPEGTDPLDTECLRAGTPARFEKNVPVLSRSDYQTIPTTLGTAIQPGYGGVAGEVRDCDDIRLQAAQVGYDPSPGVRSYSNGNPNKTVFDLGADGNGTSRLGLFTGINIAPGFATVEAWGKVGGAAAFLGRYRVKVWPDTVSTTTLNGGRPPTP